MHTNEDLRMRGIIPAIVVIGIGVLLLLRNMDIAFVQDLWRYWPGILIAVGLARLVDAHHQQAQVTGGILVGVGAILLANTLGVLHLTWNDAWPLVLIGAGIVMLYTRLMPARPATTRTTADIDGSLNECAVFGGVSRKMTTDDFHGGQVSAIFGGVEIRAGARFGAGLSSFSQAREYGVKTRNGVPVAVITASRSCRATS